MNKRLKHYLLAVTVLAAAGCGSHKATAPTVNRYQRPPIHEVSEEQLAIDNRLIDALTLPECGRTDEALGAYAHLTADAPTCAAAWYGQGQLLLQRGWTDSALHCLQHAASLNDSNEWYLLALTKGYGRVGDTRGLTATWERLVKLKPEVLEHYYELSNAYLAAGDLQAAVEVLNRVEKRVGVTEPVSLQKQRLWEAAGRPDKAMKEIEALANAMPQEKRYNAIMAEMQMKQKHYAKAKQYYDRVLKADPDDEYIHIQLAEYYKQTGHPAEADSELVRAFANPKLDPRSKMQILTSFYTEEEFYGSRSATTFRLLEQTVAESTDPSEYALFYGDVLMRQKKYPEAAQQIALALQRDSSRYEVWEGLLICLSETPDREEDMVVYARRAERLFPMHTLPHFLVGLYERRHEHYAEAVAALEKAVKWGFNKGYLEAETRSLIADCYYNAGQYDKAWAAYEQYIALRPDDMLTLNNYAYYLALQGVNLEKALTMSRTTIERQPDDPNSLDTYAWILHLLGRDAEALPYIQKAARLNPSSDTVQEHLRAISSNSQ